MFAKSILTKSQQRWFWFVAVTSVFLTSNGLYLWMFDTVEMFYMLNVLAHLVVGLLFAIPFIVFSIDHYRTSRRTRNRSSKFVGYALFVVIIVSLATGIYLTFKGVRRDQQWVLWTHIVVTLLGIAGFTMHRLMSQHKERLGLATLRETGIVLAGLAALTAVHFASHATQPKPHVAATPVSFYPSPIQSATGDFLNADALADNESCRPCHPDSYAQWESSIHAKAAYNADPFHRRTFQYMLRTSEPNLIRFCSGCHDPVLLVSGQMQELKAPVDFSGLKYANAGLTCNACHAMESIDKRGNGGYTLAEPLQYPFAQSTSALGKWVNNLLIEVKPEAHRKSYLKPFHKTSEFCAVCHKLAVPEAVNHYKWMRGQNQYDIWHNSGMSNNSAVSWYSAPKPFNACQECHMKRVGSSEFGAMDGTIPNHWTPAANSAMAILSHDTSWLKRTEAFLKDNRVSVDLFGVVTGNTASTAHQLIAPLNAHGATLEAGASARLEVVLRTRVVGHRFPECTVDINEVRVEVIGRDVNGREFFHSGAVDPATHEASPTSHFVRSRLFTQGDTIISKHNINDWTGTLYNNAMAPGSAQTVHYRIAVPRDAGDHVTFIAQLHYRKFNNYYTQWSLEGFDTTGLLRPLPYDIMMSADTVQIAVGQASAAPTITSTPKIRERFNDYGIGLFIQGDIRGASDAFTRVTQIDPKWADGYINIARTAMNEGDIPTMKEALDNAERAQPDFYKTRYFRGQLYKMTGEYDKALSELNTVNARFPLDRSTINTITRLYYLKGEYARSMEWCRKELDIDPEDFTAHYSLALCFGALGQTDSARAHNAEYKSYKMDEKVNEYALPYRLANPDENNEADLIHEHPNDLEKKAPVRGSRGQKPSAPAKRTSGEVALRTK